MSDSSDISRGSEWEPDGSLLLHNISSLATMDDQMAAGPMATLQDAAVIMEQGRIVWVGAADEAPAADDAIDLGGRSVLPGWVDSHTHLVFAGDRSSEFVARMAGEQYTAGGIMDTARATRAASTEDLVDGIRRHLAEMARGGTTCVETKTGYGLTQPDEVRSVQAAVLAGVDAVTFLGAHAVPDEFTGETDDYVDLVCGPMLDAVADQVQFVDVFCEDGAFNDSQARRVLAAAERHQLRTKVHGNQLGTGSGVQLAVSARAISVDHCTHLQQADIDALASSSTIATLLPITDLSTRQPAARGRDLVDAGVQIAIASNCNPGSGYSSSMALAVALGVLQCGLSVGEAVAAATLGGAKALGRTDVGMIAVGRRADLHVIDAPGPEYLAYRVGVPLTSAVWRSGVRVV